jgi:hypothetical protein
MWTQWLERTLNAHDADAYAARRAVYDEPRDDDGEMAGDAERADSKSAACCMAE